jgi:hypothetical protein
MQLKLYKDFLLFFLTMLSALLQLQRLIEVSLEAIQPLWIFTSYYQY